MVTNIQPSNISNLETGIVIAPNSGIPRKETTIINTTYENKLVAVVITKLDKYI